MADNLRRISQLKSSKLDGSIMGTNESSIVSKRSVERLYYPDEPHFFRYFVEKPRRRAPLINRGYWLRMKAIEYVVRQFLEEPSEKPKIIMNLGCGYDPNPWQYIYRYPKACENVTFIDVDYMALMQRKRDIVRNTPELNVMLANTSYPELGNLLLQSDQYLQVGCDLRDLANLTTVLEAVIDVSKCIILCTAEVSITYMKVDAADALLEWAAELPDARFCLLEQILPQGSLFPFAKTMLAHFEKLNTPIRAARKYPTTADQEVRFKKSGWKNVKALNLWELWGSPEFLTSSQRIALDQVEPFDEWEELALFACHYFILAASNKPHPNWSLVTITSHNQAESPHSEKILAPMVYAEHQKPHGYRRFGATLPIRGLNRDRDFIADFGGIGLKTRLSSYDIYAPSLSSNQLFHRSHPLEVPCARMCHTTTDLGDAGTLLVGGRSSPDKGLADCWLYHKWTNTWEHVDDLPESRYRHSAASIGADSVLIIGGKSDSRTIVRSFLIWSRRRGWIKCATSFVTEDKPGFDQQDLGLNDNKQLAIFGGVLGAFEAKFSNDQTITGILAGGMALDGLISQDVWIWTLYGHDGSDPSITLRRADADRFVARFGATISYQLDRLLVVGGVARDAIIPTDQEIFILNKVQDQGKKKRILADKVQCHGLFPLPLLIGCTLSSSDNTILLMGGGAVCFSFGTFWNRGCFTLILGMQPIRKHFESHDSLMQSLEAWKLLQTIESFPTGNATSTGGKFFVLNEEKKLDSVKIPRTTISTEYDFSALIALRKPAILEGLDLGSCTTTWTSSYLQDHIGRDNKVIVHQATAEHMDFVSKNFRYVTKTFGEFMEAVDVGERLYLRSLSAEKPSELPAELDRDFPTIADDFRLPLELNFVRENAHSSALRISGPVNMWLHYDVMANVLCQIRGHKKLLLFPPSDIQHFNFSPGASSSDMDVFAMLNGKELAETNIHEAILRPGDVLFLPALWLHTASPTDGVSVAVNVFFRSLKDGYASGKDIYGNRDLQAYEKGRQDITRIVKSFANLPTDARKFYLLRLAEELRKTVD